MNIRISPVLLALPLFFYVGSASALNTAREKDIAVSHITIQDAPVDGYTSNEPGDEAFFREKLSEQASLTITGEIEKKLHPHLLSKLGSFFHRSDSNDIRSKLPGSMVLEGVLTMPVSLPPQLDAAGAKSRPGSLATVHLTLKDGTGKSFAETDVALPWSEINWSTGGRHLRRTKSVDDVLFDAARVISTEALAALFEKLQSLPDRS